jgi:hypothetical protein
MTATELSETRWPIVSVPRQRRHTRIAVFGLLAFILLYLALLAGNLYEFLALAPAARQHGALGRLVSDALSAGMFSLIAFNFFIDWSRPVVISETAIDLRGFHIPWERIVSCRWNHYSRSTLMIEMSDGKAHTRHTVTVPEAHRALVEEALRHFGKWQGAQPESIPA